MKVDRIFKYALAALIVVGFFVLLVVLVINPIPKDNDTLMNMAVGSLLAAFSLIVGFFFGSSLGSQRKTEIMNEKNNENLPIG